MEVTTNTKHLTGSDFEDLVMSRCEQMKTRRMACIGKYGVKVRFDPQVNAYRPILSLPDFEGVFGIHATHVIFDTKVCSQALFALNEYRVDERKSKSLQLRHMYDRSGFGAVCFFLIHFNARELKTKTVEAQTWAFPVSYSHPFWQRFESREESSISVANCEEFAVRVEWDMFENDRTLRPNIMTPILEMASELGSQSWSRTKILRLGR